MEYLVFSTEKEADDRSRQAWVAVLGRAKRPEDVTEFLWDRIVSDDGKAALVISESSEKLTASEQSKLTDTADFAVAVDEAVGEVTVLKAVVE